jgi:3-methyl-2-oxobutanoate hydroxymethyltransferase
MKRKNKLSTLQMADMKRSGEKLSWVTAYDMPLAYAAEQAGIDMILVGDSGGMVQLGYTTTNPVTMDEMITLAKAARRGAPNTFMIGDMPQGSYEVSDAVAIENALRFVKEAGCDAIKLEGGRRMVNRVKAISDAGILVFGHLGLTPQSSSSFGGYRIQGKSLQSFEANIEDAFALQTAGVCAILLEAMPEEVAAVFTKLLSVPIYGIGTGMQVDGQLMIMHDLLGLYPAFRPAFAKCYIPAALAAFQARLAATPDLRKLGREERQDGLLSLSQLAIETYAAEVRDQVFPSAEYCYPISSEDLAFLKTSKYWPDKVADAVDDPFTPVVHPRVQGLGRY